VVTAYLTKRLLAKINYNLAKVLAIQKGAPPAFICLKALSFKIHALFKGRRKLRAVVFII
jgi:hypothetical protein